MAQAKGTQVVTWKEELAKQAAEAAKGETPMSQFLSFRGGILTFNNAQIPGNKLNVIIMDSAFENAWYPGAYDADRPRSPSCYAIGRAQTEMVPHDDAEDKQSETCASCEKNEWGSDPDGGKGKACKNQRRIALIDAEVLKSGPEGIKAAQIVYARLPVTSGKFYSSYVIQIANVVKRPPYGVISEVSVAPDPRTQFTVKWSYVAEVPDALVLSLMERNKAIGDDIMFPYPPNAEETPPPAKGRPNTTTSKGRKLG